MTEAFQTTATPTLVVNDGARAIDFYKRAFGAEELMRHADPTGKIAHAEVAIGGARFALKDDGPGYGDRSPDSLGGTSVLMGLVVEDVDAVTEQAVAAGARVMIPIDDQPYGFRAGRVIDPFGHMWIIQTPLG